MFASRCCDWIICGKTGNISTPLALSLHSTGGTDRFLVLVLSLGPERPRFRVTEEDGNGLPSLGWVSCGGFGEDIGPGSVDPLRPVPRVP